jgi:hypothetical protein
MKILVNLKFLLLILFKQPKAEILTQIQLQKVACDIVLCAISGFFLHPLRDVRHLRTHKKNIHLVSLSL